MIFDSIPTKNIVYIIAYSDDPMPAGGKVSFYQLLIKSLPIVKSFYTKSVMQINSYILNKLFETELMQALITRRKGSFSNNKKAQTCRS